MKNILLWGSTTLKPDTIDAAASDAIAAWDRQVATNPPDAAALAEAATMTTEVLEKLNAEEAP